MKLTELIENHIIAMGGYEKVEGLNSLQVNFHLVEPTFIDYAITK